jgi:hypothetical protein
MKTLNIILVVLLGLFAVNSCKKDGGSQNSNNTNSKDTTKNTPPPIPIPVVLVTTTPLNIFLPNNCLQSFTITNTGPTGSVLDFTVADDGSLGGFLNLGTTAGSLAAGVSATIFVNVKPAFVNSSPSLNGASLVVNVYTPKASNFTKVPVQIYIKGISTIIPLFLGTWSGTWTGLSYGANNPNQAAPTSNVSGTWIIDLQKIDTATMTAAGSLTWSGADAYWTYIISNNAIASAMANLFIPNRTIKFDATNATFVYVPLFNGCTSSVIQLTIAGFKNQPNPSDAFYGPNFIGNFDISSNLVTSVGVGFSTHPYAPVSFATNVSSGSITGKKQ